MFGYVQCDCVCGVCGGGSVYMVSVLCVCVCVCVFVCVCLCVCVFVCVFYVWMCGVCL